MKRLISGFLTFFLVSVMVLTGAGITQAYADITPVDKIGEAYVISRNVSIRTSPNESAQIIKSGLNGEKYNVIEENGAWYTIRLDDGTVGYALSCYFMLNPKMVFTCEGAPVYAAPSLTNKRVGYVPAGELYVVIAETDNYYIINLRTAAGYISKYTLMLNSNQFDWYLSQTPVTGTVVNATKAYVYPEPGYKALKNYAVGDKVTIYAIQDGYYAVSYWYSETEEIVAFVPMTDVTVDY